MVDPKDKIEKDIFQFKQFSISQKDCSMKVGTDGILLGAWADTNQVENILDIGTGTGLIALMMAQRSNAATIHAVEIDELAWKEASANIENSPWKDRVTAFNDSVQDYARSYRGAYDLIVSNPPFFSGGVFSSKEERANVRHTIKLPNGDLLSAARNLLTKEGRFCVILPVIEGLRFKEMAKNYGLHCTKVTEVQPAPDKAPNRLLMQFEKDAKNPQEDRFIIRNQDGQYSQQQIDLTKDFYLNL